MILLDSLNLEIKTLLTGTVCDSTSNNYIEEVWIFWEQIVLGIDKLLLRSILGIALIQDQVPMRFK